MATATRSLWEGLRLTLKHLFAARKSRRPLAIFGQNYFKEPDGIATIQYPHEILPVPVTGRYRLHNEIDDCIVCDKCAKVCPVDCITIEAVRAVEEFGKTSDGTPRRIYAAKFDINMGQCCFCGLCTTVCPTECLTMTSVYDFSVTDIREHTFAYAEMTPEEIAEKKNLFDQYQRDRKKESAPAAPPSGASTTGAPKPVSRPAFRPKIKPSGPTGTPPPSSTP